MSRSKRIASNTFIHIHSFAENFCTLHNHENVRFVALLSLNADNPRILVLKNLNYHHLLNMCHVVVMHKSYVI